MRQENWNTLSVNIQRNVVFNSIILEVTAVKVCHQMGHQISSSEMMCQKGFTSFQKSRHWSRTILKGWAKGITDRTLLKAVLGEAVGGQLAAGHQCCWKESQVLPETHEVSTLEPGRDTSSFWVSLQHPLLMKFKTGADGKEIYLESTSIIAGHKERVNWELRGDQLIIEINVIWEKIFVDIKTWSPRI